MSGFGGAVAGVVWVMVLIPALSIGLVWAASNAGRVLPRWTVVAVPTDPDAPDCRWMADGYNSVPWTFATRFGAEAMAHRETPMMHGTALLIVVPVHKEASCTTRSN